MIRTLLESGFLNTTFWILLAVWVVTLLGLAPNPRRPLGRALVVVLLCCSLGHLALAVYRGYSVPRDILQDIVAADEYLHGRRMHPDDMNQRMADALNLEGERLSLLEHWPSLRDHERRQLQDMLSSHWVQAHPPFMTVMTAPFVRGFGFLGTQLAFLVLGLLALALMLRLIQKELFIFHYRTVSIVIFGIALGWDPLLTIFRSGQTGVMLAALLVCSWVCLRHDKPIAAGIFAAAAISLKLIPGIILVPLLMRHRPAFLSAVITILLIAFAVLLLTSLQDHIDYFTSSRGVVDEYAAYPTNISLLGFLARAGRSLGWDWGVAKWIWMGVGFFSAVGMMILFRHQPTTLAARRESMNLEFALAMTLMPLLSPVAWDHYLTFLLFPIAVLLHHVLRVPTRSRMILLASLVLLLAIPDTTYQFGVSLLHASGYRWIGTWFVLPIRTFLVIATACWLFILIRSLEKSPRTHSPTTSMGGGNVEVLSGVPCVRVDSDLPTFVA